ncbi:MAG: acyl-CoA dehydrogenase family protein [Acidimicrobiales bacterium]|jgi:alkylation response protein AidB-like acyl-CoA dehydrogenase
MNFRDGDEEAAFRLALRSWLADNRPEPPYPSNHGKDGNAFARAWHRTMYSGGWLGLSWPVEYGGRGLSPLYDAIVNEEVGASGAPPVPSVGFLGRPILRFGTPEQCREYLPPMLRGELQWCQGFSEPGAGSDLASLTTRGVLDGDRYIVNGQKVWTSRAQYSDWCLLLCRTRPDLPKHKGISCLVFKMDSPGITVRPLRQVWGTAEFNEVFFDDLEVPVAQRIGEDGDGWILATTVLAHERGPADIGMISKFEVMLARLEALLAKLPEQERTALAPRVAEAFTAVAACRRHVLKSLSLRAQGLPPGPETSVDKLLMTRASQALGALVFETSASELVLGENDDALFEYLHSRASSIYGGTEQIQRTIVAQRVLGMPRGG